MPDPCTIALQTDKQLMDIHNTMQDNVVDRDELQASLINTVIDGMDFKTMWSVLYDYMDASYDKYSVDELIEEVQEYYPELLED